MPSQTFTAQQGYQKWAVPKGVTRVVVDVKGAGSGSSKAGRVQGQLKVKDDDSLWLLVGEAGKAPSGASGGDRTAGGGGAGGDASPGNHGGYSGGGASAIRLNSADGTIKVVAGGAGGKSGDGGNGGSGGGPTGQAGALGPSGTGQVGASTGGTQSQAGNGGTSSAGAGLGGDDAEGGNLGRGGHGGSSASRSTHGGGGGGGGWRAGGGGAAALIGVAPGGGGGAGSSFTEGIYTGLQTGQGTGGTGDGVITLTWISSTAKNQPPTAPSQAKVDGKNESKAMSTRSTGNLKVSAVLNDPDNTQVQHAPEHSGDPTTFTQRSSQVRLVVRYSTTSSFARHTDERSDYVKTGKRAEVKLTGLTQNTHYFLRLYGEDPEGLLSLSYNSVDLWTNRDPTEPVLQSPGDNAVIRVVDSVTFDWAHKDPDSGDGQRSFEVRWRRARTSDAPPGAWKTTTRQTSSDTLVVDPGEFKAGIYYDWTVRTQDDQKQWGPFAAPRSFAVLGSSATPRLTYPINGTAADAGEELTFTWRFRDPAAGEAQTRADLRYRAVPPSGQSGSEWVVLAGDVFTPGADGSWTLPPGTFNPGVHYEWAVQTYHTADTLPSDWSESEDFWSYLSAPAANLPVDIGLTSNTLDCGTHRAFVYDRGGLVPRGEITPLVSTTYTRHRDDLGTMSVTTNGFGVDCGALLSTVHTWLMELVIFRDVGGVLTRVAEGPITLIEDSVDGFTIQAKDVMGYVYRRIMRQGYNDSYHLVNGVPEGILTVVQRAGLIIANALAPNDPNVLPYLTLLTHGDDARESRVVADYAKTAWEEVDDMAANAGLDYSVIGRRIILNDTHRPIGRLAEMRSANFSDPPKITEYGMLLADYYAVTNNAGLWGAAHHEDSPYGGVEILVSSFSEVSGGAGEVLTKQKQEQLRQVLVTQAKRGIASRYPAPYIVRVPDNSTLDPATPVGINQLVPGVWIPLRAEGTVVSVSQWQKLDTVTVTESAEQGETVAVTMSPAPNGGQDPDADAAAEEAT